MTATANFAPVLDFLNEFGTDTDLWVVGCAVSSEWDDAAGGLAFVALIADPHPFDDPHFTLWAGHSGGPAGRVWSASSERVSVHTDIVEARAAFAGRAATLK